MNTISYYCQKCRAANEPGSSICRECGTRLMIVVFPPSIRHEEGIVPSYYEDHLLERVSLLELRLGQVTEQLKLAYEFISREAKSFQKDHALLQSFFETLEKINPDLSNLLSQNTLEIWDEKKEKRQAEDKQGRLLKEILANHDSKQAELFTHLIKESIKLLGQNEEKQAFMTLERALLLSPQNVPLLIFIAENLFRTDKFASAVENLEKAYKFAPQNNKVLLLLGAISADKPDAETARRLLSILANKKETALCVNYVWGMLAAFEENWTESLAAFKEALSVEENAEILYLAGCIYFQLQQYENALQNLQKAVSIDIKFADAWFMQSLVHENLDNQESAENTRAAALEAKEAGAQCLEYLKGKKQPDFESALPFLHFKKSKKLLTGGSLRLTNFFREQVFKAVR
ncbi:MAG: tetratricopeptide repeat protein [Pyrinomonadaceae bacterium]